MRSIYTKWCGSRCTTFDPSWFNFILIKHVCLYKANIQPSGWQTIPQSWWRHQMETFFALLAFCAGNSPVTSEFPAQRPVTRSFDVFFDLHLRKRLSNQSWCWWFETPSCSLWRHCNVNSGPVVLSFRKGGSAHTTEKKTRLVALYHRSYDNFDIRQ